MGDIIFFLFFNIIFLTFLFWILAIFFEIFFSKKLHILKKDFYECGFKSISNLNININLNFIIFISLFILYDSEILLLLPFIFNINNFSVFLLFFILVIFFMLFILFFIDEFTSSFNWIL